MKKVTPPTLYPFAIESQYSDRILALVDVNNKKTMKTFDKNVKPLIKKYYDDLKSAKEKKVLLKDAGELSNVMEILKLIEALTFGVFTESRMLDAANRFVKDLDLFSMKQFNSQARLHGIDLLQTDDTIKDYVTASIKKNVGYIKSIATQQHDKIETIIFEGMKSGQSIASIRSGIEEVGKVSRNKAQFIAVDQSGKMFGELNKMRHEAAGVEEFVWLTAGDERVRPEHRNYSGRKFNYKDGANGKFPGSSDYRCRCVAQPVF